MRFLLHGMVFKTSTGENVIIKSHLLRHAFTTHAAQVEKIPLDIVGSWMKHKNLDVTEYYSTPTPSQVAHNSDKWLESITTLVNLGRAVERSPIEIQALYNEAKKKVGTLNKVIGRTCSSSSFCPSKFQCMGCAAKIPEPEKADEIVFMRRWALNSEKQYRKLGLNVEANKMLEIAKLCDRELHEIKLIEDYRRDEQHDPTIRIET